MSEYVIVGRSGNDINNAINRCHEPNTTPLNGVEDKFVTSDGLYQALHNLDILSNFDSDSRLVSNQVWVSNDTRVPTSAAIGKNIIPTITMYYMHHRGNDPYGEDRWNYIENDGNQVTLSDRPFTYGTTGGGVVSGAPTTNAFGGSIIHVPDTGHTVVEVYVRSRMGIGNAGANDDCHFIMWKKEPGSSQVKVYDFNAANYSDSVVYPSGIDDYFDHFRLDVAPGTSLEVSYSGDSSYGDYDGSNISISVSVINYNLELPS